MPTKLKNVKKNEKGYETLMARTRKCTNYSKQKGRGWKIKHISFRWSLNLNVQNLKHESVVAALIGARDDAEAARSLKRETKRGERNKKWMKRNKNRVPMYFCGCTIHP